jgi:hypothetical protein
LAPGYHIGSRIIEGACSGPVNGRPRIAEASWTTTGAENAMRLLAAQINLDRDSLQECEWKYERRRLYGFVDRDSPEISDLRLSHAVRTITGCSGTCGNWEKGIAAERSISAAQDGMLCGIGLTR